MASRLFHAVVVSSTVLLTGGALASSAGCASATAMQPTQPSGDAAPAEASLDDAPATPDAPRADTASALPTNTDAALADAALADARAGEAGWPTTKGVTCAEVDGEARCCRHDGTTHENRCCFVAASQRCDPCTYEGPRACVPDPSGSP